MEEEPGFNLCCVLQCYQTLPREKITDKFLWGRLEPMLGYLSVEQKDKILEGLNLAFDSHSGQVALPFAMLPMSERKYSASMIPHYASQGPAGYVRSAPYAKGPHAEGGAVGVQLRKSGEPFITHPVEVTRILAELKMDYESLIAGLLHDTVEDTENVKFEEIEVRPLAPPCADLQHQVVSENSCLHLGTSCFKLSFVNHLNSASSASHVLRPGWARRCQGTDQTSARPAVLFW